MDEPAQTLSTEGRRMFELVLYARAEHVEPISAALLDELGALSVSVEDADASTPAEAALFGEPGMPPPQGWTRSALSALFTDEASATAAAAVLRAGRHADFELKSIRAVPDEDWVRLTQSQFAPVEITPQFWIVPSWHEPPRGATHVIRLDPGMAFGTGTHATTRMCLRWIANHAAACSASWSRVLDYGCGSGILAIGAALHGGRGIDAVDIDPAAIDATLANAKSNGVRLNAASPEAAQGSYPLVLANILATPLKLLAPLLCAHVAPGGDLVLAGILERQADELTQAYAPWCDLQVGDSEDGWVLMSARLQR
jgi:ribosomal protein L11 methyltransferase